MSSFSLPGRRFNLSKTLRKLLGGKLDWQESYPSFILGAIIVVILGLLVANFISRRNSQSIESGVQTEQAAQQAQAPKAGSEYTVRENDSLSKISEAVYGNQEQWMKIAQANNITTPNRILVGAVLKIPAADAMASAPAEMAQTSYEVQQGDTYFTIAEKMYGNGSMWTTLFRANGARRLPNGNPLVFSGTTIVIPR